MSSDDIEKDLNNGIALDVPLLIDDIDVPYCLELRTSNKENIGMKRKELQQ